MPEHPHLAAVEDCYSALVWLAARAAELNLNKGRLMVAGSSADGLVAAGIDTAVLSCSLLLTLHPQQARVSHGTVLALRGT